MIPGTHLSQNGGDPAEFGAGPILHGMRPISCGARPILESDTYTDAIGADLGIVGAEQTAPDLATLQPDITATVSGNRVDIDWDWQGYGKFLDMAELQVDRNDAKGFVILAFDTTPGYLDTTPFPATPTVWKYRAIYRVDDAQVGLWSAPVSVTVGG